MKNIKITQLLNDKQKKQVTSIFYEGLTLKIKHLYFHTKTREQALFILLNSIQFDQGIYAIKKGNILGFVGLNLGDKPYVPAKYKVYRNAFSKFYGFYRYITYKLYLKAHLINDDIIQIDPIIVSKKARGMGVGSYLINEVEKKQKKIA